MAAPVGSGDIQAVQRVAQLMALFTVHRPHLTAAQAASLTGLNRSTVARYFGTMSQVGMLERARDEPTAYAPGQLLLQLGAVAQGQRRVLDIAPTFMRRLSREAQLTVVLSLLGPSGPVVSLVIEIGTFPILITVRVGSVLDMDSAQGHLFLRFSKDEDTVTRYWDRLPKAERLRVDRRVAAIYDHGLTWSHTPDLDVAALAAPIFGDHDVAATIALVGTTTSLPEGDVAKYQWLRRAAYDISHELGGTETWKSHIDPEN